MNGALISPNETKHHLKLGGQIHLAPVVWGIRIQPTFALVRVVRGD